MDPSALDCPICHDCIEEPVSMPCGHSFCHACLCTWAGGGGLTRGGVRSLGGRSTGVRPCPVCRAALPPPPYQPNLLLRAMLQTHHHVDCPDRCGWRGPSRRLAAHAETCPDRVRPCPHTGCPFEGPASSLEEHQSVCPHTPCFGSVCGCHEVGTPVAMLEHAVQCPWSAVRRYVDSRCAAPAPTEPPRSTLVPPHATSVPVPWETIRIPSTALPYLHDLSEELEHYFRDALSARPD